MGTLSSDFKSFESKKLHCVELELEGPIRIYDVC